MTRAERLDWWLNRKVFTRIADWTDYHFSRNHYDLAIYCLIIEIAAVALLAGRSMLMRWWGNVGLDCFIMVIVFTFNVPKIRRLEEASRIYETTEAMVPTPVVQYFAYPPWMRLIPVPIAVVLSLPSSFLESSVPTAIIAFLGMSWLMWSTYSDYFAIVLRPPRSRQKKKAPDFSGALQPISVRS
jgi:hypothetical protein